MATKNTINVYLTYDTEDIQLLNQLVVVLNRTKIFSIFLSPFTESGIAPTVMVDMETQVAKCDVMIAFCTRKSLRSEIVKVEIKMAGEMGKPVFPLVDATAKMRGMGNVLGDGKRVCFQERNPEWLARKILERLALLQTRIGITRELLVEANHTLSGVTQKSRNSQRKRTESSRSKYEIFRKVVAEALGNIGYSITEYQSFRFAKASFDIKAVGRGKRIWIKCVPGDISQKMRALRKFGRPKPEASDDVWIVSPAINERAYSLWGNVGITHVNIYDLISELDLELRKPLLGTSGELLTGRLTSLQTSENALMELLEKPESQHLEFKSTLRYNLMKTGLDSCLEKACLKTICAFLNADGGVLIIGVSDKRQLIGLSYDHESLKSKDYFENHLANLVSSKLGSQFLSHVKISFVTIDQKDICKVTVSPSIAPVYLKEGNVEEFYVRTGNNSRPFSMSEALEYVKEHWK